jgi:hypothetical protein
MVAALLAISVPALAMLRMLSSNALSMVVGFWERFARALDFERLGVEWVPETAQPLRRGAHPG